MAPTYPPAPEPGSEGPATVRLTLAGHNSDLFKTVIFLDRVTGGDNPASVLRVLHLAAITIISESRRGNRVTLILQLEEATR